MPSARDLVDVLTGRRPELRNRLKFFLLTPIYDAIFRLLPANPHAEIARRIPARARRVLDLCTGTALVPAAVAPARPDLMIVGLDLSPEMLGAAKAKIAARALRNVALVQADAARLPFADRSFDAVTVSYGLHELPPAVRCGALAEVRRVLAPEGSLVVADLDRPPRARFLTDLYLRVGEPAHARGVVDGGLVQLIRAADFEVEATPAAGAVPMQVAVARPRVAAAVSAS
jgi:demethylmenaquinone methyltransferase / 2-methoxy-6-polyprenyl-1,4-benzoquinol methylase